MLHLFCCGDLPNWLNQIRAHLEKQMMKLIESYQKAGDIHDVGLFQTCWKSEYSPCEKFTAWMHKYTYGIVNNRQKNVCIFQRREFWEKFQSEKKTHSNNFNNFSSRKYRNLVLQAKFKLVGTLRCSYCFDTLHIHQKSKLASSNTNHNIHCNYEYETQTQTVDQISKHQDRYNKFFSKFDWNSSE